MSLRMTLYPLLSTIGSTQEDKKSPQHDFDVKAVASTQRMFETNHELLLD